MFALSHIPRYLVVLLGFLLLVTPAESANRPDLSSASQATRTGVSTLELEMLRVINDIRSGAGLAELQFEFRSLDMAQEQVLDMAERGYFDHTRPGFPDRSAESFGQRVRRFGFRGSVAENLSTTRGYTPRDSLRTAVDGWMRSPGHRANILNPAYRYTGIAHYRWPVQVGRRRGTATQWRDNWVQVFLSPR